MRRLWIAVVAIAIVSLASVAGAGGKPPRPVRKPPTSLKLGGISLSKITNEEFDKAVSETLTPLGYKASSVSESTACVWEGRFTSITKDNSRFFLMFMRPWAQPDEACNPKDARGPDELAEREPARLYDKKAEVAVYLSPNIDGTTTPEQKAQLEKDAKLLFDALIKQ